MHFSGLRTAMHAIRIILANTPFAPNCDVDVAIRLLTCCTAPITLIQSLECTTHTVRQPCSIIHLVDLFVGGFLAVVVGLGAEASLRAAKRITKAQFAIDWYQYWETGTNNGYVNIDNSGHSWHYKLFCLQSVVFVFSRLG